MTEFTYNIEQIAQVASQVILQLRSNIVLLYGELGVGKTTLIKELLKQLGVKGTISSPTYGLIHEYEGPKGPIYHMDCYRLNSIEEAINIGLEEYLDSDDLLLIEWPEKVISLIDNKYVSLRVSRNADGTRTLNLEHT